MGVPLPRDFYQRDPRVVAPALLNKLVVVADGRAGRIVEVEAYCGAADPAAHTYRGKTQRNATMFGPAGHLYVYFSYGIHWCANTVCGGVGEGVGVLLRAIEPVQCVDAIRQARGHLRGDRELGSGPGRLAQALGITGELNGADLVARDHGIWLMDDGVPPPVTPAATPRIGISKGVEHPWRWHVPGNLHVSKVRAAYQRRT
ncbi:DNA-3-methyladenine glycosylase [Pseudoxanthomonas mexicana]|jgi:DNA-3-methyladenine glycosylase|uniref:DNA-3-methyladenine glycosylase n=1 Tax=Pseudoxanthomonas mexicana TaxID=128785 RepID=UPI0009F9DD41|nr:DNA-3-methyladenine glycosylase [Pseudoxanthomonas mexicana]